MSMKALFFVFFFCCTTAFTFAQPGSNAFVTEQPDPSMPKGEVGKDFNVTDAQGRKQGNWVRVYQDGTMYYKGTFKDDQPDGLFWFWYDSGEPMRLVDHLNGSKHMFAKHYHKNGHILSKGHYREGIDPKTGEKDRLKDGEWFFYNEEGVLMTQENYKVGLKHGVSKEFFDSGKLLQEENYVEGKLEGKAVEYYESTRVRSEKNYKEGTFHGAFKVFASDGQLMIQGNYANGKKDGIWIEFNNRNKIRLTSKFKDGTEISSRRENGEFTEYYDNGIPKNHYTYENGKKNGPFTEWYEQGEWIREPMDTPLPGGGIQFREKLVNTQVKYEGDYLDDQLEGTVTWYYENGRVTKVEEYINGELISSEEK